MDDDRHELERGQAVLAVFRRGAEFARELLEDNQRLRDELQRVRGRQDEAARNPQDWDKLREELLSRIGDLESENRDMRDRLENIEGENQHFASRCVAIEQENDNLANLYVASFQLHATLDPNEVIEAIVEIVINLIGAETFCVYVYDERNRTLEAVAAEGAAICTFPAVRLGSGVVGGSLEAREVQARSVAPAAGAPATGEALVAIPLHVGERPIGAIAIHSLLQQKQGFTDLDYELFGLLAGHAATAIRASQLHAQSERKLSTIQGFIELLTR